MSNAGLRAARHRRRNRGSPFPAIPAIERDAEGIAKGGVRLPDVVVPISSISLAVTTTAALSALVGQRQPFPAGKLKALYPSHEAYVAKVAAAAKAAREAGLILPNGERTTSRRRRLPPFRSDAV